MMRNLNFVCALFGVALGYPCLGQRMYTVTPVPGPVPTGTTYNVATWISDDGTVVYGSVFDTSQKDGAGFAIGQCYISTNGQAQLFSTPGFSCADGGAGQYSDGVTNGGANAKGQFVGTLSSVQLIGTVATAFGNLNGSFNLLGDQLPGAGPNASLGTWSTGIDQNGDVVGFAYISGLYGFLASSNGNITQLPLQQAYAINSSGSAIAGDIVGPTTTGSPAPPQPRNAAIYSNGTVTNLGTLGGPSVSPNGPESVALAVNDLGQAVGWSELVPTNFNDPSTIFDEGFFWDGQKMNAIVINNSTGAPAYNLAISLNNHGEVVGNYYTGTVTGFGQLFSGGAQTHAYYYFDGKATDLNNQLVNPPAGLVLATANYINANGQILASASNADGSRPTYILTPVSSTATPTGQKPREPRRTR
jgi:hypothetical protein